MYYSIYDDETMMKELYYEFIPRKKLFVDTAAEMFGDGAVLLNAQIRKLLQKQMFLSYWWFRKSCKLVTIQLNFLVKQTPVVLAATVQCKVSMNLVATIWKTESCSCYLKGLFLGETFSD